MARQKLEKHIDTIQSIPPHSVEFAIHHAINEIRLWQGLGDLMWDEDAAAVARLHSDNMAADCFFAHEDPHDGSSVGDRLARAGVPWAVCRENLFLGRNVSDPVAAPVDGWMQSPGHRANILTPAFDAGGIGLAADSYGGLYVTQCFLHRPLTMCDAPSALSRLWSTLFAPCVHPQGR